MNFLVVLAVLVAFGVVGLVLVGAAVSILVAAGPSLDEVGGRWDAAKLRMILVNPKRVFTDESVMPAFYRVDGLHRVRAEFEHRPILTPQQVEDVVALLQTLK